MTLQGSNAIVTGAAQGLGLGMVKELARQGASVTIADIQEEKAQAEALRLSGEGLKVSAAVLDVTQSDKVAEFFEAYVSQNGKLDILVNNAGLGQSVTPIVELADAEWLRVLDVTLNGTFYCARQAARVMERQESGAIVNISSINGQDPAALVAGYNVAKAGVISLTRTLAMELAAYNVRVNAICPGPVYTEFNRTVMAQRAESLNLTEADMVDRIRAAIPLGRWGEPNDIASAVAFLCSEAASWITGEVLTVSGGLKGVSAAPPKRK